MVYQGAHVRLYGVFARWSCVHCNDLGQSVVASLTLDDHIYLALRPCAVRQRWISRPARKGRGKEGKEEEEEQEEKEAEIGGKEIGGGGRRGEAGNGDGERERGGGKEINRRNMGKEEDDRERGGGR